MRKVFFSQFVFGLALAICLKPATAAAVNIPDKNLEAALRAEVHDKKDKPDQPLTEDDLKKVHNLTAKGKGIGDLTGLEHCTNLMALDLANNAIVSVEPLKSLTKVQTLTLAHNRIKDISSLSSLAGLQYLDLEDNQVASLEPLAKLKDLTALYAGMNKIADLKPLTTLSKLASLGLSANQVTDLKPIETLSRLTVLNLNENRIADVVPITNLRRLNLLLLERNAISDLGPLVEAANADAADKHEFAPFLRLYISGNPLSEKARGEQLDGLKTAGVHVLRDD
jgi:internalin A